MLDTFEEVDLRVFNTPGSSKLILVRLPNSFD